LLVVIRELLAVVKMEDFDLWINACKLVGSCFQDCDTYDIGEFGNYAIPKHFVNYNVLPFKQEAINYK